MISLTIDKNKFKIEGKGSVKEICAEELGAILYIRNDLAEKMSISKEITNDMIIEILHEQE